MQNMNSGVNEYFINNENEYYNGENKLRFGQI